VTQQWKDGEIGTRTEADHRTISRRLSQPQTSLCSCTKTKSSAEHARHLRTLPRFPTTTGGAINRPQSPSLLSRHLDAPARWQASHCDLDLALRRNRPQSACACVHALPETSSRRARPRRLRRSIQGAVVITPSTFAKAATSASCITPASTAAPLITFVASRANRLIGLIAARAIDSRFLTPRVVAAASRHQSQAVGMHSQPLSPCHRRLLGEHRRITVDNGSAQVA
jgi:hypothetical protein